MFDIDYLQDHQDLCGAESNATVESVDLYVLLAILTDRLQSKKQNSAWDTIAYYQVSMSTMYPYAACY